MRIHYSIEFDTFYQSEDGLSWRRITLGKLQKDLMHFAFKYPGIHSYDANHRGTQVKRLAELGYIRHFPELQQFQIAN